MYYDKKYKRWVGEGGLANNIKDTLYQALEGVDVEIKDEEFFTSKGELLAIDYTKQELNKAIELFDTLHKQNTLLKRAYFRRIKRNLSDKEILEELTE